MEVCNLLLCWNVIRPHNVSSILFFGNYVVFINFYMFSFVALIGLWETLFFSLSSQYVIGSSNVAFKISNSSNGLSNQVSSLCNSAKFKFGTTSLQQLIVYRYSKLSYAYVQYFNYLKLSPDKYRPVQACVDLNFLCFFHDVLIKKIFPWSAFKIPKDYMNDILLSVVALSASSGGILVSYQQHYLRVIYSMILT